MQLGSKPYHALPPALHVRLLAVLVGDVITVGRVEKDMAARVERCVLFWEGAGGRAGRGQGREGGEGGGAGERREGVERARPLCLCFGFPILGCAPARHRRCIVQKGGERKRGR